MPKDISSILGKDFELMGLIEFRKVRAKKSLTNDKSKSMNDDGDESAATTFYITKLMQSFLLTQSGNTGQIQKQDKDKFIIVETNFRIFAYTDSQLYKEILK